MYTTSTNNTNNIYLPDSIINIIFEYMAGLNNLKWKPVINENTGKLLWKMNKYNKSTKCIENILKFKLQNPPQIIPLLCGHLSCDAIIMCIKKKVIEKYLLQYQRNGFDEDAIISVNSYIYNSGFKLKSYLFREYLPDPTFWISEITDIIWNNYGITLIINDNIDGWNGDWQYINNDWRFVINLPEDYLHQEQNNWDNWDNWEDPLENDDNYDP